MAEPLVPGGFVALAAGGWHHIWIDDETIIELHATGSFGVELAAP